MKSPSLLFHQCTISNSWRISGTLLILNSGCLHNCYPATSGISGMQDYRHQAEEAGILPCNNEIKIPCYRVDTKARRIEGILGNAYAIRPNIINIFGNERTIDYIHSDFTSREYLNSITLITENPLDGEFNKKMESIYNLGFMSIPLVISYSRFGAINIE